MREGVGAAAAALHIEVLGVAVSPALAALDGNHVGLEAGNLVHLLASGISKRVPLPAPDVAAVADESVAFVSAGFAGLAAHEHEESLRHGRRRHRRRRGRWRRCGCRVDGDLFSSRLLVSRLGLFRREPEHVECLALADGRLVALDGGAPPCVVAKCTASLVGLE